MIIYENYDFNFNVLFPFLSFIHSFYFHCNLWVC